MTDRNILKQTAFSCPSHVLAFGFGSGLAPKAPGTFGSAAAVLPFLVLAQLPVLMYLFLLLFCFFIGIRICENASRSLGSHDHGSIVWDEFVGLWITLFAVPFTWYWILTGFVLFRFFDIIKPFPIRWLDKQVGGGLGIMIDDVVAGIFGLIVLQVLVWLL